MTVLEFLALKLVDLRSRQNDGKGISQYELASRTGVPQSIIWRIENQEVKRVDVIQIRRLARFFGVSVDSMVGTFDQDVNREAAVA